MDATNRDEYLISVLFDIDKDGESKFKAATQMAGRRVATVATAAAGMAVSFGAAVLKASSELSKFSLQATRAGTSESKIRALGYAFEQVGGNAGQAMQSVTNLRTKLRDMPAVAQGMKRVLNVDAFDKATGKLRDHVDILRDMGKAFQKMGSAQATLAGAQFGLDADTVDLLRSGKLEKFYDKALDDQRRMGIDLDENARKATQFMNSINRGIEMTKVYMLASLTDFAGAWVEAFVDKLPDLFGSWLKFQHKVLESFKNDGVWSTLKDWYNDEGAFKPQTKGVLETLTPEEKKRVSFSPTKENVQAVKGDDGRKEAPNGYISSRAPLASLEPANPFDVRSSYAVPKAKPDGVAMLQGAFNTGNAPQVNAFNPTASVGLNAPAVVTTPTGETAVSNVTNNNQTTNTSNAQSSNVNITQNITVNGGQDLARATGDAVRGATHDGLRSFGSAIR